MNGNSPIGDPPAEPGGGSAADPTGGATGGRTRDSTGGSTGGGATPRRRRRRAVALAGAVAGVLVLAGIGAVVVTQRAGAAESTGPGSTGSGSTGSGSTGSGSTGSGSTGSGSTGSGSTAADPAPLGPGRGTCANRQDPALRALVEQGLPAATGARAAATSDVCLPGQERWLSVELDGRVLTVADLPAGTWPPATPGTVAAPTESGGTVVVPDRYPQLLAYLAPRL